MLRAYKNYKIIHGGKIINGMCLITNDDKIVGIKNDTAGAEEIIDGNGAYLSAGFIDIHVHGGNGYDFMDACPEEYGEIARFHAAHGTTSMYPTAVASHAEQINMLADAYEKTENTNGARFHGIHLEGPYISPAQCGALDKRYIHDPEKNEYEAMLSRDCIKRMTIAPELGGALELGAYLKENGKMASIGHTDASCNQTIEAFNTGAFPILTHFYSAMSMTRRVNAFRQGGVVEAGYLLDDIYVEVIADGCHLPPELLRLIVKSKRKDRVILVTDAMRAAGMTEGEFILGARSNGIRVVVEDGVAKLMDRTAFAGSIATMDRLLRTIVGVGVSVEDAVTMMTENPAKAMGIDESFGSLDEGKAADIVIFSDKLEILETVIGGKTVFKK